MRGDNAGGDVAPPPDDLNARIGVLVRREVEARILAPFVESLAERFGRAEVLEVLGDTILRVATEQGAALAESQGGHGLGDFARGLEFWTRGGAMEITLLEGDEERLAFDVTRCRYAELYRSLGISELGALLSCNRDGALISGFAPDITLTRTQTIMQGAPCCDFRYSRGSTGETKGDPTTA